MVDHGTMKCFEKLTNEKNTNKDDKSFSKLAFTLWSDCWVFAFMLVKIVSCFTEIFWLLLRWFDGLIYRCVLIIYLELFTR